MSSPVTQSPARVIPGLLASLLLLALFVALMVRPGSALALLITFVAALISVGMAAARVLTVLGEREP